MISGIAIVVGAVIGAIARPRGRGCGLRRRGVDRVQPQDVGLIDS